MDPIRPEAQAQMPSFVLPLLACARPDPSVDPPLVFVRGAVIASGASPAGRVEGRALGSGRILVDWAWTPGERVTVGGRTATAPHTAECAPLFAVDLGDASAGVALGGDTPDTALAFAPDGERLAVGTALGELWLLDGFTGEVRARRALAEALVRTIGWSPAGDVVYAAEQSADAFVYALEPRDLSVRARYRLADDVMTSPPPPPGDPYGVYTLPAAYGLEVLPDGDLIVAATHGWPTPEGRRNASRVLRLRLDGDRLVQVAAWPPHGAADAVLGALAVSAADGRVAVAVRRSADGPAPTDIPIDGVQVLGAADLAPVRQERFAPLAPWFPTSFVWDALALDGDSVIVGFGDGRLAVRGPAPADRALGTPILAGDVPVGASIGFLRRAGDTVLAVTSRSAIPYGAASPELRPPSAHPNENHLWAFDRALRPRWSWTGPQVLTGIATNGAEVVVGAGPRATDRRLDLFGAVVFDVAGDGAPTAVCPTEGPVHHHLAIARDGRVAVAEVPWLDGDVVRGAYRATVLR